MSSYLDHLARDSAMKMKSGLVDTDGRNLLGRVDLVLAVRRSVPVGGVLSTLGVEAPSNTDG